MNTLLTALLILLIMGCSPTTKITQLDSADITATRFSFTPTAQQSTPEQWWRQFDDDQLNRLIEQLFNSNLSIKTAHSRLLQAKAVLRISQAPLLPWLNISGKAERQRIPGIAIDRTGDDHRVSLTAGYELDLWNKLESHQAAADYRLKISTSELNGLYLSLSAELASHYFTYQEQLQHYQLAMQQLQLRQRYRDFVQQRYNHGIETSAAIYAAEQQVALANTTVQSVQKNITSSTQAIALLLGIRYDKLNLQPTSAKINTLLPPSVGLPVDLLFQRPDVNAAWQQFAVADAEHAAAIADRLPTVSLQASVGLLHNSLTSSSINDLFWTLTANALQPLLDGGLRQATVDKNRAIVKQRSNEARQALLKAIAEVEDLLNKLTAEQQISQQLDQRHQQAMANQALVGHQYQRGLNDALQLLAVSDDKLSAERQLLASNYQRLNYMIGLNRAIGGTWMEQIQTAKEAL